MSDDEEQELKKKKKKKRIIISVLVIFAVLVLGCIAFYLFIAFWRALISGAAPAILQGLFEGFFKAIFNA